MLHHQRTSVAAPDLQARAHNTRASITWPKTAIIRGHKACVQAGMLHNGNHRTDHQCNSSLLCSTCCASKQVLAERRLTLPAVCHDMIGMPGTCDSDTLCHTTLCADHSTCQRPAQKLQQQERLGPGSKNVRLDRSLAAKGRTNLLLVGPLTCFWNVHAAAHKPDT
jgi:hypothetical protein